MDELTSQIVQGMYGAVMTGGHLTDALRPLAKRYDEVIFVFRLQNQGGNGQEYPYVETLNAAPTFLQDFARVAHGNPNSAALLKAPLGELMRLNRYAQFSQLENTEYNHEFLRRHNNIENSSAIILKREGVNTAQINVNFPRGFNGSALFDLEGTLERLMPFAQSAYQLSLEMNARRAEEALMKAETFWLNQLPTPSFIVAKGGVVKVMNKSAEQYLRTSPLLQLSRSKQLVAIRSEDHLLLESLLVQTLTKRLPAGPIMLTNAFAPGIMLSGLPLHSLYDAPDYHRFFMVEGDLALITLFDPRDLPQADEELIQRLLGLTHKQSQLVLGLANGATLRETADSLGMSYNTARNHMQNATGRVGVNSQTELVRLVGTISAHSGRFSWGQDKA
ncbi:helix-turn-helix transcriptional regulator [Pseudovibrio sp. SPO723]|uniref:helix-turn-helix transcriptional regulator n=1 Tax=Nesiotobacter zosterae TaxID=392721 RepID=UPI0029C1AA58|nr:helix-turn-helix transcriptional regulator [Pseudovibrio sp. SPO723]MDX5593373.1 helix-turn-helix transcriptional regulator [Pseudovibrio sp. SPO723]